MEGNEVDIFSWAPNKIPLILLKIKIKQNPGCLNKEYNAIFEHIQLNIRAYPRSKKICIDQLLWKYNCLFRRVWAKQGVGEQVQFLPNTSGRSEGQCHLRKIWLFLLPFLLTQNGYISKYKRTLLLKTGNLILNWVPLSFFYKHSMPERLSSPSILPNSLVNWE